MDLPRSQTMADAYRSMYEQVSVDETDNLTEMEDKTKPSSVGRYTVTSADKKANTPAYQKFKSGDKRYKAADHMNEDSVESGDKEQLDEKEGKKDACYHKVKSRYDVWPSAYASGALVKCRAKGAKNWGNSSKKEEVEAVFATLIGEGFAHDEVSAINILSHMSDDWYDTFVEEMINEANADRGVSGDEAMKRHGIKAHEGPMKVKKLPTRKMRKGEGLGVGARKRQGAGRPDAQARGGPVRFQ